MLSHSRSFIHLALFFILSSSLCGMYLEAVFCQDLSTLYLNYAVLSRHQCILTNEIAIISYMCSYHYHIMHSMHWLPQVHIYHMLLHKEFWKFYSWSSCPNSCYMNILIGCREHIFFHVLWPVMKVFFSILLDWLLTMILCVMLFSSLYFFKL